MEIEESALERRAAGVDDDGEDGSIKMGGGGEGEEGDKSVAAARNEEFEEEDGETGQPLVAADEVADNLKVWARSLQRPPKGNLKVGRPLCVCVCVSAPSPLPTPHSTFSQTQTVFQ